MSKGQHGNREAKKPKKAHVPTPPPAAPAIVPALPVREFKRK